MVGEEFPVFSDAPVEGWWAQKGSGNSVSYEIFREITTTTETAYETAATESLGIAVSGGFEFVGVSASVEVRLTSESDCLPLYLRSLKALLFILLSLGKQRVDQDSYFLYFKYLFRNSRRIVYSQVSRH